MALIRSTERRLTTSPKSRLIYFITQHTICLGDIRTATGKVLMRNPLDKIEEKLHGGWHLQPVPPACELSKIPFNLLHNATHNVSRGCWHLHPIPPLVPLIVKNREA